MRGLWPHNHLRYGTGRSVCPLHSKRGTGCSPRGPPRSAAPSRRRPTPPRPSLSRPGVPVPHRGETTRPDARRQPCGAAQACTPPQKSTAPGAPRRRPIVATELQTCNYSRVMSTQWGTNVPVTIGAPGRNKFCAGPPFLGQNVSRHQCASQFAATVLIRPSSEQHGLGCRRCHPHRKFLGNQSPRRRSALASCS